jgi:hypothetical protein
MNHALSLSLFGTKFRFDGKQFFTFAALALVAMFSIVAPDTAFAAAGELQDKADEAYSWLELAVGFILTVAVLGSGVLAAFGQISWKTVGQVLIGCIVAGLAATVVSALYG